MQNKSIKQHKNNTKIISDSSVLHEDKKISIQQTIEEKYDNTPYWKPKKLRDVEEFLRKEGYSLL